MTLYVIPVSPDEFIEVDTATGMSQARSFPSRDPIGDPYPTTQGELVSVRLRQEQEASNALFREWDDACLASRAALTDVLALAALYPFGTVEETAIVDTQAAAALAAYRSLPDPPADVVSLASAVVAWRVAL